MQQLLNSFSASIPCSGIYASCAGDINQSMYNFNGYYYNGTGLEQDETLASESPPRTDVDESGYQSSGSSVYEVLSEDEEDNNHTETITQDQDDEGTNNIDAE
jgi:hypothetical protein